MRKISGIYIITNIANGKVYIGKSVDILKRWSHHIWELKNNVHKNDFLQKSWNNHGEGSFTFNIIAEAGVGDLPELESFYIKMYRSNESKYGYNLTSGGEKEVVYSLEAKAKMSKSQTGHIVSSETKQRIGKSNSGKVWTDERKLKASISRLGVKPAPMSAAARERRSKEQIGVPKWSEDQKKEIAARSKGKKHTEETKEKMSESLIGNTRWQGKTHSEETKAKMAASRKLYWERKHSEIEEI